MTLGRHREAKGFVRFRVPRAGKIRLGEKRTSSKSGRAYPVEVPYFVLDADLPGRARILELYGEKPTRILVTFLSNDPREVLPYPYKAYGKGLGLTCRGDGETADRAEVEVIDGHRRLKRDEQGVMVTTERRCPCDWLRARPAKCKVLGNLVVVLPEVGLEHYQIDTGSWHSINNVHNALRHYADVFNAGEEGLRGRLFWLERRAVETHGSGRKETHYPLHLSLPTPDEYAERLTRIGGLAERYHSLLGGMPRLEPRQDPVALPMGSAVEEPDLVAAKDQVDTEAEAFVKALREPSIVGAVLKAAGDLGIPLDREHPLASYDTDTLRRIYDAVFPKVDA